MSTQVAVDEGARPLTIMTICTGNICRSALAHHYLAEHLEAGDGTTFRIRSGGLGWFEDLRVPDELLGAVPELAGRLRAHQPGPVSLDALRSADLILTATAEHRRAVLSEVPSAFKRVFMVEEFAMIVRSRSLQPGTDPDSWRMAIAEAARHRGFVDARDIPDPYRRGRAAYDDMVAVLVPALETIVQASGRSARSEPVESSG